MTVTEGSVDQTAGATRLCRRCYPKNKGAVPVAVGDKPDGGGG
ncbi:MAG: hypothetical protein ABIO48_15330 [Pedococcus sp.]